MSDSLTEWCVIWCCDGGRTCPCIFSERETRGLVEKGSRVLLSFRLVGGYPCKTLSLSRKTQSGVWSSCGEGVLCFFTSSFTSSTSAFGTDYCVQAVAVEVVAAGRVSAAGLVVVVVEAGTPAAAVGVSVDVATAVVG